MAVRLFFDKADNHRVATATAAEKRLLPQKDDCVEAVSGRGKGGIKSEANFTIIVLTDASVADMAYLLQPKDVAALDPDDSRLTIDHREKTTDIATLRVAMSADDRKRLDGHRDFPVDPVTVRREAPEMTKAAFEAQVRDR